MTPKNAAADNVLLSAAVLQGHGPIPLVHFGTHWSNGPKTIGPAM